MTDLLLALLHVAVMSAKLCGPGGVRAVIAENLLLKQGSTLRTLPTSLGGALTLVGEQLQEDRRR